MPDSKPGFGVSESARYADDTTSQDRKIQIKQRGRTLCGGQLRELAGSKDGEKPIFRANFNSPQYFEVKVWSLQAQTSYEHLQDNAILRELNHLSKREQLSKRGVESVEEAPLILKSWSSNFNKADKALHLPACLSGISSSALSPGLAEPRFSWCSNRRSPSAASSSLIGPRKGRYRL